jgi:hypothetical protein
MLEIRVGVRAAHRPVGLAPALRRRGTDRLASRTPGGVTAGLGLADGSGAGPGPVTDCRRTATAGFRQPSSRRRFRSPRASSAGVSARGWRRRSSMTWNPPPWPIKARSCSINSGWPRATMKVACSRPADRSADLGGAPPVTLGSGATSTQRVHRLPTHPAGDPQPRMGTTPVQFRHAPTLLARRDAAPLGFVSSPL